MSHKSSFDFTFVGDLLRELNVWLLNDTHNPLKSDQKILCTYRQFPLEPNTDGIRIRCDQRGVGR